MVLSVHEHDGNVAGPHTPVAEPQAPRTFEDYPAQLSELVRHELDMLVTTSHGPYRLGHRQLAGSFTDEVHQALALTHGPYNLGRDPPRHRRAFVSLQRPPAVARSPPADHATAP